VIESVVKLAVLHPRIQDRVSREPRFRLSVEPVSEPPASSHAVARGSTPRAQRAQPDPDRRLVTRSWMRG